MSELTVTSKGMTSESLWQLVNEQGKRPTEKMKSPLYNDKFKHPM